MEILSVVTDMFEVLLIDHIDICLSYQRRSLDMELSSSKFDKFVKGYREDKFLLVLAVIHLINESKVRQFEGGVYLKLVDYLFLLSTTNIFKCFRLKVSLQLLIFFHSPFYFAHIFFRSDKQSQFVGKLFFYKDKPNLNSLVPKQ